MIRWHLTRAALAVYLFAFALACRLRSLLPSPPPGFDRAGGPYNGHPASDRRQREGAGRSGERLAKGGNGASHDLAGAA